MYRFTIERPTGKLLEVADLGEVDGEGEFYLYTDRYMVTVECENLLEGYSKAKNVAVEMCIRRYQREQNIHLNWLLNIQEKLSDLRHYCNPTAFHDFMKEGE